MNKLSESHKPVRVQGLAKLLRSIALRLEGEVDGLSKELLEQSASRIESLEGVAVAARELTLTCGHSKVPTRMIVCQDKVTELKTALHNAGYVVV